VGDDEAGRDAEGEAVHVVRHVPEDRDGFHRDLGSIL
jgi:hypothetical protein